MIQHFRRSTGTSLAARLTMDPKIFNCKQVSFAAVLVKQIWRKVYYATFSIKCKAKYCTVL